jgi:hypothetical protein
MEQPTPSVPFWESVRAWADSMGLLLPQGDGPTGEAARPPVPQSVCDSCPICQGAATLDQVNPDAIAELVSVARDLIGGIGSALASAADQRLAAGEAGDEPGGQGPGGDEPGGDEPSRDQPGGDEPSRDQPGGDEPSRDQPPSADPRASEG